MKKLFPLLLCFFLLLSSCRQEVPDEPAEQPEPALGVFYQECGIWQNTLLTLCIEQDTFTAPAKGEVALTFYNNTDYTCLFYTDQITLFQWQDGGFSSGICYRNEIFYFPKEISPHSTFHTSITLSFQEDTEGSKRGPLDVGFYLIQASISLVDTPEECGKPEDLFAVSYFQVTPA